MRYSGGRGTGGGRRVGLITGGAGGTALALATIGQCSELLRGDLDDTLHGVVAGGHALGMYALTPGYGGADPVRIEDHTPDRAALDRIGGGGRQGDLPLNFKVQALPPVQGLPPVQEAFLEVANPSGLGSEGAIIQGEGGPIRMLVLQSQM